MKEILLKIWKDPVWSKVISTGITGITIIIWSQLSSGSFELVVSKINMQIPTNLWILIVITTLAILYIIEKIKIKFKKTILIENEADALAVVDAWWPDSTGGWLPNDVKVNFKEIEENNKLSPDTVQKVIHEVATRRGFKAKFRGDTHATYEYDHGRG
jgi:hypothetical protein